MGTGCCVAGQEHPQAAVFSCATHPFALPLPGVKYPWSAGAGDLSSSGMLSHAAARESILLPQISPRSITGAAPGRWVRQYSTCHSFITLHHSVRQLGESLSCTMALAAGFSILLHC